MTAQSISKFATALLTICVLAGLSPVHAAQSQILNAGWLLEAARNVVLTSDPWAAEGCTVEISGSPSDITVYREGQIEVEARLERVPNGLRDIGAVTVEVFVGGQLYLRFDPSPYLSVSVGVFRSARDLDRGEVLTEDDIESATVDVRTLPSGDTCHGTEEIVGLAARMNIQVGRILTPGMLEPPTLVFRGETVVVHVPLGTAAVTLQGIALDSGGLGEEIRVRNPDSNAIITAVVSGPSEAEINIL